MLDASPEYFVLIAIHGVMSPILTSKPVYYPASTYWNKLIEEIVNASSAKILKA